MTDNPDNKASSRISSLEVILRIAALFLSLAVLILAFATVVGVPYQTKHNITVIAPSIAACGFYILVRSLTLSRWPWMVVSAIGIIGGTILLADINSELMKLRSALIWADTKEKLVAEQLLLAIFPLLIVGLAARDIMLRLSAMLVIWMTK